MKLHSKQDFQVLMHLFLDPLKPLYSSGGAHLHLGETGATYQEEVAELEAFSRPLWGLVPYWMGGGVDETFERIYRKGLANGTSLQSPEYWGGFSDYDQRFVEMAAIACGLLFAPQKLWEPLSAEEKAALVQWLDGINGHTIPDCNWQFFRVLVNLALKKCGMPCSEERLTDGLEQIDSYYLGGGWYRDGASCQKDYYIPFAIHYYGLIYATAMEKEDPVRCALYKARATEFAQDFIYWFADDGAALPFGRSLTYRFAQAGFWSACLFAGIEPFPVKVMKGIIVRHFEYWLSRDIVDRDGILTIGYGYPNLIMAERYNAPGSPYWSMKAFLFLALPDEHPFWRADAAPLPVLRPLKALKGADMLIQRRAGDVVAYTPGACELFGHGHLPEKYSKFAYSTRFGFSVARSQLVLHENAPDSMLAFVLDGSSYVFTRLAGTQYEATDTAVYAEWSPFPGITVKTVITPTSAGHTRRHEIESRYDCTAYDCGFAVDKFCEGYAESLADNTASVRNAACGCTVAGRGPGATPYIIEADPNTNTLCRNTKIPAMRYTVTKGKHVIETQVVTS